MTRAYLFIDAENHFIRSTEASNRILEIGQWLQLLSDVVPYHERAKGYPEGFERKRIAWYPEGQFFWDCAWLSKRKLHLESDISVKRAVHVCSFAGDDEGIFKCRSRIRAMGFEPVIISEKKESQKRRVHQREAKGLIDKPKGCDIALATRMISDAASDLFDFCFLFTSDADFLPAIRAVRGMGKVVWVFGYADILSKLSPFHFVPDRFIDLGEFLNSVARDFNSQIQAAAQQRPPAGSSTRPSTGG